LLVTRVGPVSEFLDDMAESKAAGTKVRSVPV